MTPLSGRSEAERAYLEGCELRRGGEDPFASGGTSIWGEASLRGFLSRTKDVAGAREGAGAPLLRRGEHMGLPCPKSIEGAGPRGLKAPKEAKTRALPKPRPKRGSTGQA